MAVDKYYPFNETLVLFNDKLVHSPHINHNRVTMNIIGNNGQYFTL